MVVHCSKVHDSVRRLRNLVAVESECCSFVDRMIDDSHADLRLVVPRRFCASRGRLVSVTTTVYEAAGGYDGLLRLSRAWHERVMADEVVSHAFSHGYRADHSERLAIYWGEALGGPADYSDRYGDESFVVRMHSGNGEHEDMNRRAIACFDQALVDVGLDADDRVRQTLHDYWAWATTTTMSRYPDSASDVPEGLPIPGWSWGGPLVEER